jgi:AraC family transcriptional regulator
MNAVERNFGRTEAEMKIGLGHIELVHRYWYEPIDVVGTANAHRLELCLTPPSKNARGCFVEHWSPHRFERIGNVFLLPANQAVRAKSDCRQQQSLVCSFLPEAVAAWFEEDLLWTDARLQASLDIASPSVRSLLFRLGEEVRNPGFASTAMVESIASQIAIELARYCIGIEEQKATGGLSPWKLRLIDERLAEPGAPPSLSELATLCGLSVRHLTRAFRISRCRSIGSYITECSINQAKRLLASGVCIKSVAYSMGFNSPSNFSSAFRRATGETPREYRQRTAHGVGTH